MKRVLVLLLAVFFCGIISAQNFDNYFENKTLRIDYLHSGDYASESIEVKAYHAGGVWSGTRAYLIEPKRYGDILFQVFDAATDKLIYSRSYSTLFCEYRATERALTEVGHIEECVNMPMPKAAVKYTFTMYDRRNVGKLLYTGSYDPAKESPKPFVKECEVMNLHIGGKPENCIDILFLPDGYAKEDAKKLEKDMKRFASYVMNCTPYKENKKYVNLRAIKGYSEESGITDPNGGVFKKTLLGSSYNVIDVDRYLMCLNVWKMYEVADDAPVDIIVLICNSDKYGGGGIYNFYGTVCNGAPQADYVIVHEMGHLIGGLADEYYTSEVSVMDYYPTDVEPVEPNVTTLVDFDSKWKSMLDPNTPVPTPATADYKGVLGVYEGGGYVAKGVYRPWLDCTMKIIAYNNFCPVCTKVLVDAIGYYANKELGK